LASGGGVGALAVREVVREVFKNRRLKTWLDWHQEAYRESKDLTLLKQAGRVRDVLGDPPVETKVKNPRVAALPRRPSPSNLSSGSAGASGQSTPG
jgi:hypothetical protein